MQQGQVATDQDQLFPGLLGQSSASDRGRRCRRRREAIEGPGWGPWIAKLSQSRTGLLLASITAESAAAAGSGPGPGLVRLGASAGRRLYSSSAWQVASAAASASAGPCWLGGLPSPDGVASGSGTVGPSQSSLDVAVPSGSWLRGSASQNQQLNGPHQQTTAEAPAGGRGTEAQHLGGASF